MSDKLEALKLARPIVEADYHAAKEQCDADWEGMSFTALEAIDAALRTPTPEQAGEVERIIGTLTNAQLQALKELPQERMDRADWLTFEGLENTPLMERVGFTPKWGGHAKYRFTDTGKSVAAALQSTPPAQPTADAVERARRALDALGWHLEDRVGCRVRVEDGGGVGPASCDEAVMYDALVEIAAMLSAASPTGGE